MDHDRSPATLRIGELSRRLGISDHVLRAWERRYGLLRPVRSPGGFRLYSEADERRIRRMQANLARGMSAAEAARTALDEERAPGPGLQLQAGDERTLGSAAGALANALDGLDEPAGQAALDRLLAEFTVETVLRNVVMPYLHDLGERWADGRASVGQEHFASNLLRGRLASLARGWGHGLGPRAVLACPPGELHDLALLAFGIALNRNGWRIAYLGINTPIDELIRTSDQLRPDLVVVSAVSPERFEGLGPDLSRLARNVPLAIAGAGATRALAQSIGARLLDADPVTAAAEVPTPAAAPPAAQFPPA